MMTSSNISVDCASKQRVRRGCGDRVAPKTWHFPWFTGWRTQVPPMCTRRMGRTDRGELQVWSSHHSRRAPSNDEPSGDDFLSSDTEPARARDPRQRVEEAVLIAIIVLAI